MAIQRLPHQPRFSLKKMTYETAKNLKDAGFPTMQHSQCSRCVPGWNGEDNICIPTLEELIEACGDRFESLENNNGWIASGGSNKNIIIKVGITPSEAVANLWLELNKK